MEQGTTFLRKDSDRHLWVVLSDPKINADEVLLVNVTTLDARKEQACLLGPGDHPWITHPSCINYGDAVVSTLPKLFDAKDGGALQIQQPLAPAILQRVLLGVASSTRISLENVELLEDQGLIEI